MLQAQRRKLSNVFIYAGSVVGILVILGALFPDQFGRISSAIATWISHTFGWYYMLLYTVILGFFAFLIFSPIGKLKLGKHIKIGSKEIMTIVSLLPFCIMVGERSKTEGLAGS